MAHAHLWDARAMFGVHMQAYGALWALLGLGMLPSLRGHSIVDLPYFVGLAAVTIYIGAHRGLNSKQRQTISLGQVRVVPRNVSS